MRPNAVADVHARVPERIQEFRRAVLSASSLHRNMISISECGFSSPLPYPPIATMRRHGAVADSSACMCLAQDPVDQGSTALDDLAARRAGKMGVS